MFKSDQVLLSFRDNYIDNWTVDDAMRGTSIIGGTGSGKTTASGKFIAQQFLEAGWGGLVLCAKSDEAQLWLDYCKDAKRSKDVILFGKDSKHEKGKHAGQYFVFNPIDYELKRLGEGAADSQNIVNIFMNIHRMRDRIAGEKGDNKDERFWDTSLKRLLNKTIELIKLAGEDLTYNNMVKIISTSDNVKREDLKFAFECVKQRKEVEGLDQKSNYCFKCIFYAALKSGFSDESASIQDYFTINFPSLGEKIKATITEMFMGIAEPFLSGLLAKHFAGETNLYPETIYEKNKITIMDFPLKEYLDTGLIAQSIFKMFFQQAMERRNPKKYPMPVFLWVDEAQYFVNSYDQLFLTTARSSRTATVFLSQNIPNYYAAMGSSKDSAEAKVDSLMGNLSTKIFHANSDAKTNEYASKLIGDDLSFQPGAEVSVSETEIFKQLTDSIGSDYKPQVQPMEFTILKTGGINNNYEVEAIMMVTGKKWSDNLNHIHLSFKQEFKSK